MKIAPLIYASILFLLIRLVNDVPMGHNYFTHSTEFIAIELMGLIGGCYLYFLQQTDGLEFAPTAISSLHWSIWLLSYLQSRYLS